MGLLRFILAVSVVLAHSGSIFGFTFVGGQLAVQTFYIISGFYIALILNEKYTGVNSSYSLFITNRFLRLYPIYWFVLLCCVLYSIAISLHTQGDYLAYFTYYVNYFDSMSAGSFIFLIFTNLFLIFQDTVTFLALNTSTGNLFFTPNFRETDPMLFQFLFVPQAWTLGIEITFYLIAPFLVKRKLQTIAVLIFLSLLLRLILFQNGLKGDPWSYRFFPTELLFFLLGIVSYRLFNKAKNLKINNMICYLAFGVIVGFTFFYNFLPFNYKYPAYLFLFFICLPLIFLLTKKWKYDAAIGELSYPIYISHTFLLTCMNTFKVTKMIVSGLSLTIVTILFAIALNELISKKIERLRKKRVIQPLPTP